MTNVAALASSAIHEAQARPTGEEAAEATLQGISPVTRKLFMLLHGSYGSLFTSKFSTGQMAGRHDKGAISAMRVWDAKLSRFPGDVVEAASGRLSAEHPKFPPNLPEFEAMCDAAMPRKTYAQEQGLVALPAPKVEPVTIDLQPRNDGKDWARRIVYRLKHGDKSVCKVAREMAEEVMGLRANGAAREAA